MASATTNQPTDAPQSHALDPGTAKDTARHKTEKQAVVTQESRPTRGHVRPMQISPLWPKPAADKKWQ